MRKFLIDTCVILISCAYFVGCTSNFRITSIEKLNNIEVTLTKLIFLKPPLSTNNNIFIEISDSCISKNTLQSKLKKYVANRGYHIVDSKEVANYMILGNILQAGKISERELLAAHKLEFGNSKIHNNYCNVKNNFEKNCCIINNHQVVSVIVDINISEKYGKHWNCYSTRVISTTKFPILSITEILPRLIDEIAESVSRLF